MDNNRGADDEDDDRPQGKKWQKYSEEDDKILTKYVEENGVTNWDDVAKNTGLERSANSCRIRWYHLRNQRKGTSVISQQEKKGNNSPRNADYNYQV